jgi:asparagine synthase (glutamine-hydrolysing)
VCGINGYIGNRTNVKNLITTMNDSIIHRGPDDDGVFIDNETFSLTVGLGMRRLSIIDLATGHQPMHSEDNDYTIIFNGEIYNYLELKDLLIKSGLKFDTNSDTEVILKLFIKEGIESLTKLDGMYSLAIFDKINGIVYISRDYFGEKPLYYYKDSNGFYFGSELKSIIKVLDYKPQIDIEALNIYFQLSYIPSPFTIYSGIKKLEPNRYLKFDISKNHFEIIPLLRKSKQFDVSSKDEAIKITHDLVYNSVKNRSISDVAIGSFLSGGVDSSIVSLCHAKQSNKQINTFSIGFENTLFDESDKSSLVSNILGSNHNLLMIGEKDLEKNINNILLNFDEPFADSSCLATFILCENTRKFVKVALTGDGADEQFAGYNKYLIGKLNTFYTNIVPTVLHNQLKIFGNRILSNKIDSRDLKFKILKFINSISYQGHQYENIVSLSFKESELSSLFISPNIIVNSLNYYTRFFPELKNLNDFKNFDYLTSLEGDMLVKVDRTSMLTSLECRSPFLSKDIWDFTNQLPEKYLINGFEKKYILKESFKKYFPKNFFNNPKKGFGVPVGDWLRTILRQELLFYIDKEFIQKQSIFNYNYINNLVKDHLNQNKDNTFKVWTFYCFQKWYMNIYE